MPPACDQMGAGPCAAGVTPNGLGPTPNILGTLSGTAGANAPGGAAASGRPGGTAGASGSLGCRRRRRRRRRQPRRPPRRPGGRRPAAASSSDRPPRRTTTTQPELVSADPVTTYHAWTALARWRTWYAVLLLLRCSPCPWSSGTGTTAPARRAHEELGIPCVRRSRHHGRDCGLALAIIVPSLPAEPRAAGARTPATPARSPRPRRSHATTWSNGVDQVVDTRTVTLNVSQTTEPAGSPGDRRVVVGSPSDRRHRGRPEFDQGPVRGVPLRPARVPGDRLHAGRAADQLSPETCWTQTWSEHYQDSLDDAVPAVPPGRVRRRRRTGAIVGAPSPLPASCHGRRGRHRRPALGALRRGRTGRSTTAATAAVRASHRSPTTSAARRCPSNETFGVTGTDGTGSADFDVFDIRRERLARLLARRCPAPWSRSRSWASAATPAACRPPPSPADVTMCEETGAFAPGRADDRRQRRRSRPDGQREACGGARRTGATASPCRSPSPHRPTPAAS